MLEWSENSCAYDAMLSIIYNCWRENPNLWSEQFNVGSEYMVHLCHSFNNVANGVAHLNGVHDTFRRLLEHDWLRQCAWGVSTSIHFLLKQLFKSPDHAVVSTIACPKGQTTNRAEVLPSNCCISVPLDCVNIQEFVNNMEIQLASVCQVCSEPLVRRYSFISMPKILIFDLSTHVPQLADVIMISTDRGMVKYQLKGVILYNNDHFMS